MSDPFPKPCPKCGHTFTLAELKTMAVGDGWRRFIIVEEKDGTLQPVDFNDFEPSTMTEAYSHPSGARIMPLGHSSS
ncbi:hypothetical protein [Sphingomonas crocodyli]|uniref:Uncharacterized protein n=1 Tax=Sphingomonas crocodyli TaxID=1979270 RepID=A0A437M864_9SPHN|nr:hypothetical protein [Sphingomonas crocodyli]RVT93725.1 hypothetical protein EOD43_07620 [Sphingomonas crocodyli]